MLRLGASVSQGWFSVGPRWLSVSTAAKIPRHLDQSRATGDGVDHSSTDDEGANAEGEDFDDEKERAGSRGGAASTTKLAQKTPEHWRLSSPPPASSGTPPAVRASPPAAAAGSEMSVYSEDAWKGLGDADPLTVDPQLVPVELRDWVIELQREYQELAPYEEELNNSSIWQQFDQESSEVLEEWDARWMNNEEQPLTAQTVAANQAKRDRLYDTVEANYVQKTLKDPAKVAELFSLQFIKDQQKLMAHRRAHLSPTFRAALKGEEDLLNPKMTHEIHRLIKDALDD
jgi:hypothetical protein